MNAILDPLEIEDLPTQTLRDVAGVIGIGLLKELIVKCPGAKIYIPKSVKWVSNLKYVRENFNGGNHKAIAEHLGITPRSVYRLLKD